MLSSIFEWIIEQPFWGRMIPGVVFLAISGVLYWNQVMWMWGWVIGAISLLLGLLAPVLAKFGLLE